MDKIFIFDTTLRDGEQSPGASMTFEEKLTIAKSLEQMKVDIIEAGFAIASEGEFNSIKTIANTIKDSQVCSLARATTIDIERAAAALKNAAQPRIHIFIATSPIHMKMKLNMTPEQVIEQAVFAVKKARNFTDNIEFSPEDASRSNLDFLCKVIEEVIKAGATTINVPDTVGYALPEEFGNLFKQLIERIPNSDKAIFSSHCHNDLGLAVANSMAAVANGARQIECTINGLGERAGNAALEEIVMAFKTRELLTQKICNIDTSQLVPISRLVSGITGFPVQLNKAIVGANAFSHESGIHQDGILKHRETYEIMKAEDVGWNSNKLVLGKHSGKAALFSRLKELGYSLDYDKKKSVFDKFKDLADHKHEIYDDDLHTLLNNPISSKDTDEYYNLISLEASSGNNTTPKTKVTLSIDNEQITNESEGSGIIDATFKSIEKIINSSAKLMLYSVSNVTDGTDSLGEVAVRLNLQNQIINGTGYDSDIVLASAKAYIDALNRLKKSNKIHPQFNSI